jgi:hypothetical protein
MECASLTGVQGQEHSATITAPELFAQAVISFAEEG